YALALGRLLARNRRRYGGYIVHTGIVILFVAFAGMAFKTETEASLRPGESASIRSPYGWTYRLTHLGISQYDALNRQVTAATLEVSRDDKRLGVLTTEKRQHVDAFGRPTFQPSTEVGIRSDLREDLYVVLGGVVNGTEQAVFRFTINPLVWWVWYGGVVLVLGGLVVMWPGGGSPALKRVQAGYAVRLVGKRWWPTVHAASSSAGSARSPLPPCTARYRPLPPKIPSRAPDLRAGCGTPRAPVARFPP